MTDPYGDTPATQKEERYEAEGERASLRVHLYTAPFRDAGGFIRNQVVAMEVAQGTKHTKGWKPPKARPMTHYDVSDWHGSATFSLPTDTPPDEVEYRLKIARSIHGPNSNEACCRRRRAQEGAP